MLEYDPKKRLTINQIKMQNWMKANFDEIQSKKSFIKRLKSRGYNIAFFDPDSYNMEKKRQKDIE